MVGFAGWIAVYGDWGRSSLIIRIQSTHCPCHYHLWCSCCVSPTLSIPHCRIRESFPESISLPFTSHKLWLLVHIFRVNARVIINTTSIRISLQWVHTNTHTDRNGTIDHWDVKTRWCISNLNYGHIHSDMCGLIITDPGPLFHLSSGNIKPDPCLVRWEAVRPTNEGIYLESERTYKPVVDLIWMVP